MHGVVDFLLLAMLGLMMRCSDGGVRGRSHKPRQRLKGFHFLFNSWRKRHRSKVSLLPSSALSKVSSWWEQQNQHIWIWREPRFCSGSAQVLLRFLRQRAELKGEREERGGSDGGRDGGEMEG